MTQHSFHKSNRQDHAILLCCFPYSINYLNLQLLIISHLNIYLICYNLISKPSI